MGYSNINNPVNYQLQGFGQNGVRTISTDQLYIQGEYYRVLVAEEDSYVTAVSVLGDDLTAEFVYAGTTIYGLFTEVSVSSGSLTAYIAGTTDIEDVWAYINTYGQTNAARIEAADCAKDAIAPLLDKYYAKASLVMVPSLYKTSIVYSERPLTTSGQLAFTRSNDTATRVGPDGLIEKVRTNLVLQSETFDNASWVKNVATVTANTTANPLNGALTADTITLGAGTTVKYLQQSVTAFNGLITHSVYLKAGTHQFVQLLSGETTVRANFDLINGTASALNSTAQIVALANDWYRCSISYTATISPTIVYVWAVDSLAAARAASTASTGTFFIFGYQHETGDIATPYIATTTAAVSVGPVANVPRLDYLNSSCGRLLLEPQRTNLYAFSEQLNQWSAIGTPTVTANYAVSPDGYSNADRVQFASGNALFRSGTGSAGENTLSVYAKATNGTSADFRFFSNGATTFSSNQTATGEWQRFTFTYTFSAITAGLAWPTSGGGVSDVIFYGFQHEIGSYATSYIPTLGAAVTRGADAASKTGISSLIGQTEGTLFVEVDNVANTGSIDRVMAIGDGTGNNRIIVLKNATGNIFFFVASGGSTIINQTSVASTNLLSGSNKIAVAYKSGDYVIFFNGVSVFTSSAAAVPATSALFIATNEEGGVSALSGKFAQALLFKTRLTNAQLAELTA